jgi:alpha-tubulin suppressor-like RCC1 family protein
MTKLNQQIPNTQNFIQISAGMGFSLALDSYGQVWSFGLNYNGCLGLGTKTVRARIPCLIEGLPPIKAISAGCELVFVLDVNGTVWSFGDNTDGQLGLGDDRGTEFLMPGIWGADTLDNFRYSPCSPGYCSNIMCI